MAEAKSRPCNLSIMNEPTAPTLGATSLRPFVTIHFEDHGQDFLQWDVAEDGQVVDCHPFQGWHWCQGRVANLKGLDIGDTVCYESPATGAIVIKYPVQAVTTFEGDSDV